MLIALFQKNKKKKKKNKKCQSVQQQGDFVGLLLEAAQLIETEQPLSPSSNTSNTSTPITIENINELLSNP